MKRRSLAALGALMILSGCAGTRLPKLAKCTGPYRYANIYGTVLPSLPIPGQTAVSPTTVPTPAPAASAAPPADRPAAATASPPVPAPSATIITPSVPVDSSQPGKTSALLPSYPSC